VIVLDTHAWLWWMSEPAKLGARAREEVDRTDQVGIATISAWEVATLVLRDRIELDRPLERWIAHAMSNPRAVALNLTLNVALQAGLLEQARFPGDPADRIVYASARSWSARLATRDERMRAFDPHGTIWD
jgi:PIN domain nuclease of toxin-antitoxin system